LAKLLKEKKIYLLEYTSVIVRLVDSQREGHFSIRFDCDRISYQYLPTGDERKKWYILYIYNTQ
jgi:hypothetical protein